MKKKSILPIILSAITFVSLAVPAVTTAVADTANASNERTITVDIFSGNEDGVELYGASFAEEDGVSVVSMETGAWADGKIMLSSPVNLSAAREEGKLYYEYKTTGTASWGKLGIVTFANSWNEGAYVDDGGSVGLAENYTVKSFDLSSFKDTQLAKFKGFALGTSAKFVFKRVWVEYPNPDYVEGGGTYQLITSSVSSSANIAGYTYGVEIPSSYSVKSGDKIKATYTVSATSKVIDVLIGGVKLPSSIWASSETGTYEYTFTDSYSGNIVFGAWSTEFTIEYVELTIYSSGTETKKIKFYDENGGVIESLSSVEYDVTAENVLPEYSAAGKLFIGWKIGEGLYPAGGAFDAATTDSATAAAIEFGTNGAYFRIGETASVSGIRFDTEFSAQDYANIGNFVTEYGTLILPEDTLSGKELTLENFVAHETVLKVKSTTATTADGKTSYRGAILSIKETNYNRTFAARGYITVTFSDGSTKNFYSATTAENSVASMAASFMGSEGYNQLGEEQKSIVRAYAEAYQA